MKDFDVTDSFLSYATKPDPSNTDRRYLIRGSLNTLINDAEKIGSREGYTIFGAAGVSGVACQSGDDWSTSTDSVFNLRAHDTALYLYVDTVESRSFGTWESVVTGLPNANLVFDSYFDSTEKLDREVFVNGTQTIYDWGGGLTTLLSASDTPTVVEAGDTGNQLSAWVLNGVRTTNSNAFTLYWKLTNSGSTRTVNVYKDSAGLNLVATGSLVGNGSIALAQSGGSGISGSVTVAYSGDDTDVASNTLALTYGLTKEGTGTWAAARFLVADNPRKVRIKDAGGTWREFGYTGGETTTTLTGLTGNPNEYTFPVGALVMQTVRQRISAIPVATYAIDMIRVIGNQLHCQSRTDRRVYVSKNNAINDFTFSTPRIAGEGALFTLDQAGRAIRALRENPIYFTKDFIYAAGFQEITVSNTLTETATCKRLKTAAGQGAIHHDLTAETENGIAFVSVDKQFLILEDAENQDQPLISVLSDLVKPDFDALDFTGGGIRSVKNRLYICAPASGRLYIEETRQSDAGKLRFWQPPQTIAAARMMVRNGLTYAHSSQASETYLLFSGLRDRVDLTATFDLNNGTPILARAFLAHYNGGKKMRLKHMDDIAHEGHISPATVLLATEIIETVGGETQTPSHVILGGDAKVVYNSVSDPSLGTDDLGEFSLSGDASADSVTADDTILSKFRVIQELNPVDFFDYEQRYESNDIDQLWQILCTGPNAELSEEHAAANKQ